ncbi:hypothetical protein SPRG_00293 [Saprolegnia parasitica CBS 223.65]|uniref:Uncharacterized protein n=1 Tax=Saprolegnia parasitica (strain CBS 223.65) TaxID=695850 RepID=A0A067D1Q7_SAPPC|nr:hypothetical protein SPRG_00293 [Saprolegnia parasitica CBS 223.65]KDO35445.1 hypothetical protein SPRG_00293 [Saprolegnia parasitica CBS 223.65]|eukprot:XP_012193785.1 hypothetical protein SPRG_00293 [Saprolegnia parasitica CBS 223.65]
MVAPKEPAGAMASLQAQVSSTRVGLGKLASLLSDDVGQLHNEVQKKLHMVHESCIDGRTELCNALDRLEFRFQHFVRDCHVLAETVDGLRDTFEHLQRRLRRTDADVAQQQETILRQANALLSAKFDALVVDHERQLRELEREVRGRLQRTDDQLRETAAGAAARWADMDAVRTRHDHVLRSVFDQLRELRHDVGDATAARQTGAQDVDASLYDMEERMRLDSARLNDRMSALEASLAARRPSELLTLETATKARLDGLAETLTALLRLVECHVGHRAP